ncbi:MAG TPA: RNA 2',3'-cyclic phosphodiesterase [Rubrobacteraceae bacterium]|nr:RNA 2',3'-cyclic phosphodiesterase [Rubrobacteraceae bacterium]
MAVRSFVAIFPPRGIQEALHRSARGLPIEGAIRQVRPENIHLTIKFLGDVQPESLPHIGEALAAVCERHGPFHIDLSGFGAFPSERRGRILWAGVDGGSARLISLSEDVEKTLEPLDFEREPRAFRPHLTLGRARGRSFVLGEAATAERLAFRAERLTLVQSVLREDGARYEPIGDYPLGGTKPG